MKKEKGLLEVAEEYLIKKLKNETATAQEIAIIPQIFTKKVEKADERSDSDKAKSIRSKKKKMNNIVILINAENNEEMEAIKNEFLISARKAARKRELGFYITPIERASFEAIQDFADFSLEISAGNR